MEYLEPELDLGDVLPNIASMLDRNVELYGSRTAFLEKRNGLYSGITWQEFYRNIASVALNLKNYGFRKGDKMVVFSPNRLEMAEIDLALMASGGVTVPIFYNYNKDTAETLIRHSDARFLAVAGRHQLEKISRALPLDKIFVFDEEGIDFTDNRVVSFSELLKNVSDVGSAFDYSCQPRDICLNMYTSGTMGVPKCVQLTHLNILSQQKGLSLLWDIDENDRFLSYLPWHHSFGGIFERFAALYNGSALAIESGLGKEAEMIFENWKLIRPTVFFSVPKVYQALVDLTKTDEQAEDLFFNSGLKFIFTAAAPLPKKLFDEFESRGINVIEGWGLTETSPCCTITSPGSDRIHGVVGKPIAGVRIRIADDGEIQVKGPNVMKGYYKNDEANASAFSEDGWFCTGDVGEILPEGLKLVSRKDRIFKLANGEKVIPSDIEAIIHGKCHYINYAVVGGSGMDYTVALLFPNKTLLNTPTYELSPEEGCFCPRSFDELSKCLRGCLNDANCCIAAGFARIKAAVLVDDELSIESNTLTPSLKLAPNNVLKKYSAFINHLYDEEAPAEYHFSVVKLDPSKNKASNNA